MKVRKAVIPVAGLGTRFLPATKAIPKELFPIVDRPSIHYIVEEAYRADIREIIFVSASGKSAIEDYFDVDPGLESALEKAGKDDLLKMVREISAMVEIHTVRQKVALGLGHAVLSARNFVGNEPFAVLLGDDLVDSDVPCIGQMVQVAERYNSPVIGAFRVPDDKVDRYGIIDPEPESLEKGAWRCRSLVEKPKENAPSNMAIIGRYVLPAKIFDHLERTQRGVGGEIQLTDGMLALNAEDQIIAYEFEGQRYDAGDIYGFLEANLCLAMKDPELAVKLKGLMRRVLDEV